MAAFHTSTRSCWDDLTMACLLLFQALIHLLLSAEAREAILEVFGNDSLFLGFFFFFDI